MPRVQLVDIEARILGALIEKSLTTPDQYPLSLNALVNACNQKSSREPEMNLDEATVARGLSTLQAKSLVGRRSEPGSRVTKFMHHVENLLGGGNSKEVGAICVLLLRGPQTAGEIKTRTDRLCEFSAPAEVDAVLNDLVAHADGPMVERLPRQPGQKEARWRHLFADESQKSVATPTPKPAAKPTVPASAPTKSLEDRVSQLEKRVAQLERAVSAEQH
jgi:uncharacterized protein YceH (UPF0502 family)